MYLVKNAHTRLAALILSCFALVACGVGNEQGFLEAVEVNTKNLTAITVVSSNDRVRVGETESYTAMGTVEGDDTQIDISASVNWSSSDTAVVSINREGVATGLASGTVDIVASLSDLSGSKSLRSSDAPLTSIAISNQPTEVPICQTSTQNLVATGTYSDGDQAIISDKVSWLSSDGTIIRVGDDEDNKGILTALTSGSATITATQDDIVSEGVVVTAIASLNSITVSSADETLYAGGTSQFTALGDYGTDSVDITENLTWVSSNTAVLSFSETDIGNASLLSNGVTTVTATCDLGGSDNLSSETLDLVVEEPIAVSTLRVKYKDTSYDNGDIINVEVEEGSAQLELYLVYNNGDEDDEDLADDEGTTWTLTSISGDLSIGENTGLISFDADGRADIEVRFLDSDRNINETIEFVVVVE